MRGVDSQIRSAKIITIKSNSKAQKATELSKCDGIKILILKINVGKKRHPKGCRKSLISLSKRQVLYLAVINLAFFTRCGEQIPDFAYSKRDSECIFFVKDSCQSAEIFINDKE